METKFERLKNRRGEIENICDFMMQVCFIFYLKKQKTKLRSYTWPMKKKANIWTQKKVKKSYKKQISKKKS
jgi:hypothetical protein